MHEKAIVEQLITDVLVHIQGASYIAVRRVVVNVGVMTSFESSPMRYYFDLLKVEHDILKVAELRVSMVDGEDVMLREIEVD